MIGIVDYGMGNLFSVTKALERLGAACFVSEDSEELSRADSLLIPGVGSFRDAMERLDESGLVSMIRDFAGTGKPVLGICLGMQLLFEESMENGGGKGLGLLKGSVERFPGVDTAGLPYKVPHMGWNELRFVNPSPILRDAGEGHVYFVHSYYVKNADRGTLLAVCDYGEEVPAVVGKGNIFGMQFHPEKSGNLGMELLGNFTRIDACVSGRADVLKWDSSRN
ncbi:imidazole glycerol phosphate synthase subunit HisH [Mesobacillus zeae]|uniref:Imidazole glycerol phosphate synthase subunit HisH n=1 Tax=Mesobacillus zeae TaxID=1917180 RepID=A0A398BAQ9_9BACI|nr:imidazole glycerol phosphate synthase subunit HisH [Mesobacillus zeae]RID84960.1 imidazole glycerol phosphate synthase subunit HisH [Mesobacillus zeae]